MENKEIRNISTLRLWKDNPREISKKAFESLKKKIKRWGQFKPVIITNDGEVVGGNMRLRAYQELGIVDIWVSVVSPKTEAEKLEIAMADNESSGRWDEQALAELLEPYKTEIELGSYELDLGKPTPLNELLDQFGPEPVEDEVPEVSQEEPKSKLGEIYQLGRHRVMCGDSTKIEDVERLMDGKKADMVFTDPPYGIDLDTDYSGMPSRWNDKKMYQNKFTKVIGDEKPFSVKFIFEMFPKIKELFMWGADYFAYDLPNSGADGTWYVWDKREDGDDGDSFDNMIGSPFELCWGMKKRGKKFIRMRWASFLHSDASEGESSSGRVHPTQKPIALSAWFIKRFSEENWNIVDLFLGSGGCLLACEQTNRTCYGMELDPKYVDVIRKRYAKFIGKEEEWEDITPKLTDK